MSPVDLLCPVLDDILRASKLTIIHDLTFSTITGTVPIDSAFLSCPLALVSLIRGGSESFLEKYKQRSLFPQTLISARS